MKLIDELDDYLDRRNFGGVNTVYLESIRNIIRDRKNLIFSDNQRLILILEFLMDKADSELK